MDKIDYLHDSKYSPAYITSNEDIRWVVAAYPDAHDILTVAGSGDQALFYSTHNTQNIDTFDITLMAKMVQDAKTTAIQHLTYDEYIQFLVDISKNKQNQITEKIIAKMPSDSAQLLSNQTIPLKFRSTMTTSSPNLPTHAEYERMQHSIDHNFKFICTPLTKLHTHLTKRYNIINISNIFENFCGDDLSSLMAQKNTILNLLPNLKLGGRILYIPQKGKCALPELFNERVHGCKCEAPIQHPTERFIQIIPIKRTR